LASDIPFAGGLNVIKCLACGAEMGLVQVDLPVDHTAAVAFERRTYRCSVCAQISHRLEFCRPKVPVTDVPVVTTPPQPRAPKLHERVPWTKAVEELRNRRTAQTAAAKSLAWAKVAEKVRSRQRALKEQAGPANPSDNQRRDSPVARRSGVLVRSNPEKP
jgi:hypothetical protein